MLQIPVLRLNRFIPLQRCLEIKERFLRRELVHPLLKRLTVRFGPLPDRPLGLPIIRSLLGQLLGSQIGHTARRGTIELAFPARGRRGSAIIGDRCVAVGGGETGRGRGGFLLDAVGILIRSGEDSRGRVRGEWY